jgi:hypothetical protein
VTPVPALSVVLGAIAALVVAWPEHGKYVAVGLGLFAAALGLVGFRRERGRARGLLLSAAGVTLGATALVLGAAKVGLTLAAVERLGKLL